MQECFAHIALMMPIVRFSRLFLLYFAKGLYGLQRGIAATPSSKFKVQVNSILNHCGRYGSRAGNTLGVFAVLYSLYEGLADNVRILNLKKMM